MFGLAASQPLSERVPDPGGAFQLHAHRDLHVWTWAAAVAITADLRRDLQLRSRTRLLVSGSDTAAPAYRALARAPLDWDRIDIGLTDERWLQPDDPDSKASAIRQHLLRDHARGARLEPMTLLGRRIEDAVASANAHAQQPPNVIVLTLGDDGHVAGLFQDSPDYPRAVESRQAYVSLDATFSAAASPWHRRITATPLGLARSQSRLLLIRGRAQREQFDRAMAERDTGSFPLTAVLAAGGAPLQVHWCP